MILTVRPSDCLQGSITLPSSKSYSIRAFIVAACGGTSRIINPSDCDDSRVALYVIRHLGAQATKCSSNAWRVVAQRRKIRPTTINVGESGTVLRFLLPLLALEQCSFIVTADGTLRTRPNTHLIKTLKNMGVDVSARGAQQTVPIRIKESVMCTGHVSIDGSLSSQFISALLIAAPRLAEDTHLSITGKQIVSETYIEMTRQILRRAGVSVQRKTRHAFSIRGNQKFKGLKKFIVPSDWGLAAFFLVAGALCKSRITLKGNLTHRLVQADGHIVSLVRRMGIRFKKTDRSITLAGPYTLKGGDFCLKDCPDLVPILSIAALFAKGRTRLYGIRHARAKESNRISDLRKELLKIGARVTEKAGELIIYPSAQYKSNVMLDPHCDHRLAMAFAVLGLKIGAKVKNVECVSKSYPGFVRDLRMLKGRATTS